MTPWIFIIVCTSHSAINNINESRSLVKWYSIICYNSIKLFVKKVGNYYFSS